MAKVFGIHRDTYRSFKRNGNSLLAWCLLVSFSLSFISTCCQSERTGSKRSEIDPQERSTTMEKSEKQSERPTSSTTTSTSSNEASKQNSITQSTCQYEKGEWQECGPDGFQLKIQRLKKGRKDNEQGHNSPAAIDGQKGACDSVKMIRRDCKPGESSLHFFNNTFAN